MDVSCQLHAPVALPPGKNPDKYRIECWVETRAGLDVLEKKQISCPCRDSNPRPSSPYSLVSIPNRLGRLPNISINITIINLLLWNINYWDTVCFKYVDQNLKVTYRYHTEFQNNISYIIHRYTCVYDLCRHYMLLSHREGPGSIPNQSMWDTLWTKWHWERIFSSIFPC
jgi:hypothetical protein